MFALRHTFVAALAIGLCNASVSLAECKPDTAVSKNRTLFSSVSALHFDYVGSGVVVNGKSSSTFGGELAIAVCRWPQYTMGLYGEELVDVIETSYIAPGSSNFHPSLTLEFGGVSLTRRWRRSDIVHPMVSVRAGSVDASYSYYHTSNGIAERHVDGRASAGFVAPEAGAEVSLFKYMTIYLTGGVRLVGHLDTPGLSAGDLNKPFVSFGMGFGKFR
jgi:hypothetical protein